MPRDPRVLSRLGLLGLSLVLVRLRGRIVDVCAIERLDRSRDAAPRRHRAPRPTPRRRPRRHRPRPPSTLEVREFDVVAGSHPHDVAPAPDGGVWYTGQHDGTLGHLDPATGDVRTIPLGAGSAPHGVITGPDGNAWITDGGLDAIVRVDADTARSRPSRSRATGAARTSTPPSFDRDGILWFTGQTGIYGRLDPATGEMAVFDDPEGRGPYGITATPSGDVWYASLAGSHIAKVDRATGEATIVEPPTPNQGARRVWSDSRGRIWVSEWDAGQVGVHDPATGDVDRSGGSPATGRRPTPSTSTIGTSSG